MKCERQNCRTLAEIMERATGCPPCLWGTGIVGFDSYRYKYASGQEGESCVVGFSSRKGDISVHDALARAALAKQIFNGARLYLQASKMLSDNAKPAKRCGVHAEPPVKLAKAKALISMPIT
jgi:hypothetical protein